MAMIVQCGVQGSILKNSLVKEKHKQTTFWQQQALCLLFLQFPAEKQLEPYSVLWFNVVFFELNIMKEGLKLFMFSHLKS